MLAGGTFRDIAAGEADLTKRLDSRRGDELGRMAADFNAFVEKLRGIVAGIKDAQGQLASIAAGLGADAARTSASAGRISSSVGGAKDKAAGQSEVVLESASAIEEIAKNIEGMNGMVASQSACVTEASAAVEEIAATSARSPSPWRAMAERFAAVSTSWTRASRTRRGGHPGRRNRRALGLPAGGQCHHRVHRLARRTCWP